MLVVVDNCFDDIVVIVCVVGVEVIECFYDVLCGKGYVFDYGIW